MSWPGSIYPLVTAGCPEAPNKYGEVKVCGLNTEFLGSVLTSGKFSSIKL